MIDLYTTSTPNGHKVSCTLEALNLEYTTHAINLQKGEQKTKEFLAMNPNGRIPVIVDRANNDLAIFESGAIMIYLAEKAGKLLPQDIHQKSVAIQWLMFQMGGIGPMMGQANVFFRYFPEKIQPAIDRYQNESRRLFEVLNTRLEGRDWLADEFSIADIANWCWVRTHRWSGVSTDELDNLKDWIDRCYEQPGMLKGLEVPEKVENLLKDKKAAEEFAKGGGSIVQK